MAREEPGEAAGTESEQKTQEDAARQYECPECGGAGEVDGQGCLNCGGTGKAITEFS